MSNYGITKRDKAARRLKRLRISYVGFERYIANCKARGENPVKLLLLHKRLKALGWAIAELSGIYEIAFIEYCTFEERAKAQEWEDARKLKEATTESSEDLATSNTV